MSTKKKLVRCTQQQLTKLLDYMSNRKEFANGEFTGPMGHGSLMKEWESLVRSLNNEGPVKTVEQWRITWRDLKKRARDEASKIRLLHKATGNKDVPVLSDQSQIILNIIGTQSAIGIGDNETGVGELITAHSPPPTNFQSSATTPIRAFQPTDCIQSSSYTQSPPIDLQTCPLTPTFRGPEFQRYTQQSFQSPVSTPRPIRQVPIDLRSCTATPTSHKQYQTSGSTHNNSDTPLQSPISTQSTTQSQATYTPTASGSQAFFRSAGQGQAPISYELLTSHQIERNTTHIQPAPSQHQPRPRGTNSRNDFLESDQRTRKVLMDIRNEIKLQTQQMQIKNRREHQER